MVYYNGKCWYFYSGWGISFPKEKNIFLGDMFQPPGVSEESHNKKWHNSPLSHHSFSEAHS